MSELDSAETAPRRSHRIHEALFSGSVRSIATEFLVGGAALGGAFEAAVHSQEQIAFGSLGVAMVSIALGMTGLEIRDGVR